MQGIRRRLLITGLAGLGLAGSFYAGVAYAADARLDAADQNVTKAIALLQAAENPGVKPPFGGHRLKAILFLKKAQSEIAKAKTYADNPPKKKDKHEKHEKHEKDDHHGKKK
ncbi:MAG: hypothetical protein KC776_29450 [Myxococcales bacterium]|nr:hypothetical protein [Myxococcales bacterium]MCB9575731.1 hypothetical protein [Polyangiaceae bacterium]